MDFKKLFIGTYPWGKRFRYNKEFLSTPVSYDFFIKELEQISNFNFSNVSYLQDFYNEYVDKIFPDITSNSISSYSKYYFRTECLDLGSNSTQDKYWLRRGWTKEEIKEQRSKLYGTSSIGFYENRGLSKEEAKEKVNKIQKKIKIKAKITHDKRLEDNSNYYKDKSAQRKEYWIKKGFSKKEAIKKAKEENIKRQKSLQNFHKDNPGYQRDKSPICIDRWLSEGYTQEEAEALVSKHQLERAFTLEKCVERYGKEKGIIRFNKRQKLWLSNYKKVNFSQVSQKLFHKLYSKIKGKFNEIYYAELKDGKIDKSGKNNEYRLMLNNKTILPDFFVPEKKKIIEFDGTYWHGKRMMAGVNKTREKERDRAILESGYQVLHVKEKDFNENPDRVIKECLNFLK